MQARPIIGGDTYVRRHHRRDDLRRRREDHDDAGVLGSGRDAPGRRHVTSVRRCSATSPSASGRCRPCGPSTRASGRWSSRGPATSSAPACSGAAAGPVRHRRPRPRGGAGRAAHEARVGRAHLRPQRGRAGQVDEVVRAMTAGGGRKVGQVSTGRRAAARVVADPEGNRWRSRAEPGLRRAGRSSASRRSRSVTRSPGAPRRARRCSSVHGSWTARSSTSMPSLARAGGCAQRRAASWSRFSGRVQGGSWRPRGGVLDGSLQASTSLPVGARGAGTSRRTSGDVWWRRTWPRWASAIHSSTAAPGRLASCATAPGARSARRWRGVVDDVRRTTILT